MSYRDEETQKDKDAYFERLFLIIWIGCYALAFLLFLAAIWAGQWRATVTGLLVLAVGAVFNAIWGIKYREWE